MKKGFKKSLRERVEIKLSNDNHIMGIAKFKSLDDFLNAYEESGGYHGNSNDDWYYGDVPREPSREAYSDNLLKNGDIMDDIMDYIEDYKERLELEGVSSLQGQFKSCVRRRRFTDDGAEINIDRALSGEPEFWETLKRDGKKEFINIGVQLSLSAGNGLKSFAKNMALAYCVCEILENLGYGVSIDCLSSCHNQMSTKFAKRIYSDKFKVLKEDGVNCHQAETGDIFRIKDTDEKTDVRNLACTSLPSLLRKYAFHIDRIIYGYEGGQALDTTQEYLNFVGLDFLIAKQWSNGGQFENVVQTIKSLIEK